jgi:cysteine-rich repeat protein
VCTFASALAACTVKDSVTCGTDTAQCDGACVAIKEDPANCGACGNVCATGQSCVAGACVPDCNPGQAVCDGACTDTLTSAMHCGGCDQPCASDEVCDLGSCTTCGNGVWEPGEQCDDGNNTSGDGCSADCRYEGPAGSITFWFSGQVEMIKDSSSAFGGIGKVGDPVIGRYTIDPTLYDSDSQPSTGTYTTTATGYGMVMSVGGHVFATNPANVSYLVQMQNNNNGADVYLSYSYNNTAPAGIDASVLSMDIAFIDSTQTVYRDTLQQVTPIDLSRYNFNRLELNSGVSYIRGSVLATGY